MTRILITGGAGFIGSHVARILQDEHELLIIDSLEDYGAGPIPEWIRRARLKGITASLEAIDIRDLQQTTQAIVEFKPNTIIHLAGAPRAKIVDQDPVGATAAMTTALVNIMVAGGIVGTERMVFVSSSMVYGDFHPGSIHEDTRCQPKNLYGALKLAGENIVKAWANAHPGMTYTIIRPSAVYGPGDYGDRVINNFMTAALNDQHLVVAGQHERLDFTYVTDVADGIARAARSDLAANETYNITRGHAKTLLRAAQICVGLAGKGGIVIKARDETFPIRGALDISKAKRELGFDPVITLENGLMQYHDFLRHQN
jgi:UDP-glucose 4-epimerase